MKPFLIFYSKQDNCACVDYANTVYKVKHLEINVPTKTVYRDHPNDMCIGGECEKLEFVEGTNKAIIS